MNTSKNDSYGTPLKYFYEAREITGVYPQLDVCANKKNTKCERYFSKKQNGLKQEWNEDFWMNPPFSNLYGWTAKAYREHRKHNVNGVLFVPLRPSAEWWKDNIKGKAKVYFVDNRIKFLDGNNKEVKDPCMFEMCILHFAKERKN